MKDAEFGGKRTDNGEWIYGFYGYKEYTKETFIMVETIDMNHLHCPSYFTDYEIIPETAGQYTGQRDKNGAKIFEGHILTDGKNNYLVDFYKGAWDLKRDNNGDPWYKSLYRYAKDCEIIGNVFENPELIEGVNND